MKVFIITKCCSGEDYDIDVTNILGVFADEEKAKQVFQEIVRETVDNCEDDEIETDTSDCGSHYFELTNFSGDYHIVLQLHEEEFE